MEEIKKVKVTKMTDKKVRDDLILQLKAKYADINVFIDLIDRYMFFRSLELEMQRDIKERGLSYPSVSSTGKEYQKDNPSVKNAIMYNKQCLAILGQLELSPKTIEIPNDADDDDL